MQFVAPDVVLLDPRAAIASEYRNYEPPRSAFSLPAPYQSPKDDDNTASDARMPAGGAGDGSGGGGSEAGPLTSAAVLTCQGDPPANLTAGVDLEHRRKRARKAYLPNEREQQAAARHAQYAPALAAAACLVQAWLHASGAATVQAALAGAAAGGSSEEAWAGQAFLVGGALQQRQQLKGHSRPGQEQQEGMQREGPSACLAGGAQQQQEVGWDGCGKDEPDQPDYLGIYEMRHALKPMFEIAAEAAGGCRGVEVAAATCGDRAATLAAAAQQHQEQQQQRRRGEEEEGGRRRQDVKQQQQQQQQQSGHLFNRLISSSNPPFTDRSGSGSTGSGSTGRGSTGNGSAGSGSGSEEWLAYAAGHPVLLPPSCCFLMSDARQLQPLLQDVEAGGGYHCIVLDPPWENKSVKRSSRYPTLPSRHLLGLPLRKLMHRDGCLVALWVTNRERHRRFIETELLPAWGLCHLTTWHWLKITDRGQPVGRLDIQHRRPYESLLLCWPNHIAPPGPPLEPGEAEQAQQAAAAAAATTALPGAPAAAGAAAAAELGAAAAVGAAGRRQGGVKTAAAAHAAAAAGPATPAEASGFHLLPGRSLVLAAVPPAAHSRKPHLGALLLPLLPPEPRCLEMFARELHSGWTGWGNEALRFQGLQHFERRNPG